MSSVTFDEKAEEIKQIELLVPQAKEKARAMGRSSIIVRTGPKGKPGSYGVGDPWLELSKGCVALMYVTAAGQVVRAAGA